MLSMIKTFDFNSLPVRTIVQDNIVYFVAKDVAVVLGYKRPSDAIKQHCKHAQLASTLTYGDMQYLELHHSLLLIDESDVYRLIMRSNLPSSVEFQNLVFEVILPSIRRVGSFVPDFSKPAEAAKAYLEQFDRAELATATKAEIGTRREATSMNTASQAVKKVSRLEQKLEIAQNYCTIERMQRLHPFRNFSQGRLNRIISITGIPMVSVCNSAGQYFEAYHLEAWRVAYGVEGEEVLVET